MEVFTEKEEQAQQLTGRCPSLQETAIEDLVDQQQRRTVQQS